MFYCVDYKMTFPSFNFKEKVIELFSERISSGRHIYRKSLEIKISLLKNGTINSSESIIHPSYVLKFSIPPQAHSPSNI